MITIETENMKEDDVVVIEGGTVATVMEVTGEDCVTLGGIATGMLTVKRLMIVPPGNTPVPFKISIKNSDKSVTYDEIDYIQDPSESPLTISKASE